MSTAEEDVLGKADALMRRHRSFVAGAGQAPPAPLAEPEDVPVLTEVIDAGPDIRPPAAARIPSPGEGETPEEDSAERLRQMLAPLPPELARAVEGWLAATLPGLVARRLDAVAAQVAEEVGAELRETLPLLIADLVRSAAQRHDPE